MSRPGSVLLGGVPFGRDNVGDEAILECVVGVVRSLRPDLRITASTGRPDATSRLLGIETIPLLGFGGLDEPSEIRRHLAGHDAYIWSGATGLSDYPNVAVPLLETAQALGKRTAVFCAGMNTELNPALFRLRPDGPKLRLLQALRRCAFALVDPPSPSGTLASTAACAGGSPGLSRPPTW
jgi:polysaccharide pyruvyl transferase WcaK-like protein